MAAASSVPRTEPEDPYKIRRRFTSMMLYFHPSGGTQVFAGGLPCKGRRRSDGWMSARKLRFAMTQSACQSLHATSTLYCDRNRSDSKRQPRPDSSRCADSTHIGRLASVLLFFDGVGEPEAAPFDPCCEGLVVPAFRKREKACPEKNGKAVVPSPVS